MNDFATELKDVPEIPGESPALKADLLADFDKATCPAGKLAEVQIPPRAPIVESWLMEGDLGFIFGARGLGKTWLAMLLARRIAEGGTIGNWKVHRPRKVLYVDGEMPFDGRRLTFTARIAIAVFTLSRQMSFDRLGQLDPPRLSFQ